MPALEIVYSKNDAYVYRNIAGEVLLVPVYGQVADMEALYTMNEVGARIWELVDGRNSLGTIQDAIEEEFDVPPEVAREDMLEFVRELESIGALLAG